MRKKYYVTIKEMKEICDKHGFEFSGKRDRFGDYRVIVPLGPYKDTIRRDTLYKIWDALCDLYIE